MSFIINYELADVEGHHQRAYQDHFFVILVTLQAILAATCLKHSSQYSGQHPAGQASL